MNYNKYSRIVSILLLVALIPLAINAQSNLKWNTVFIEPGLTWYSYNGLVQNQNAS